MNTLSAFLKKKRTEKEMSMRKLAELANISHTEVKRIEDGTRKQPSPQVLRAIAGALGISLDEIMMIAGYVDDVPAEPIAVAKISEIDELTDDEVKEVKKYIDYLKSKRTK